MSVDLLAVKSQIKRGRQGQLCLLYLQYKSIKAIEKLNNNSKLCLNRQTQNLKVLSSTHENLYKVLSKKYEAEVNKKWTMKHKANNSGVRKKLPS